MSYDLGTAHGTIELEYKGHGAAAEAQKDMDEVGRKSKDTDKKVKDLSLSFGFLATAGKKLALGSIFSEAAVGAASLGIQILGIVPDLVSISSLAATLPGLFTGMIVSVLTLKVAFNGVGDAIKLAFQPGKLDKFNKELDSLSPSAKAFVVALHNIAPELQDYGKSIQEAFFRSADFTAILPRAASALASVFIPLRTISSDFGSLAGTIVRFGTSVQSIQFVSDALTVLDAGLADLKGAIVPVLTGLRDVGDVGLPVILQMEDAVTGLATRFGQWLSQISADGRLNDWIDQGIATLRTLGTIVENVGGILFAVIKNANAVGGGLLNTLAQITGQFSAFLNSAEGAQALQSIFSAILSVAKPLAPIITTAATALAGALGPAIINLTSVLGPALLQVVQTLAPALAPLANALSQLAVAIVPLLAPAAELVQLLARYLSGAVSALVSELGPLIKLLAGGLLQAFQTLSPVIDQLVSVALPLAAQLGAALAKAFAPVIPVLVQLAQVFSQALLDNLPQLQAAAAQLIPVIIQLATVLSGGLVKFLQALIPIMPTLVKMFVDFVTVMYRFDAIILTIITKFVQFFQFIASIPSRISAAASAISGAIQSALQTAAGFITTVGSGIINFFTALPGRLLAAIVALPGLIGNALKTALQAGVTAVAFGVGLIVGAVTKLPGDILNAIRQVIPIIGNALKSAWNAAYNATVSGINSAISFMQNFPHRASSAISSLISNLRSVAVSALNALKSAVSSGINDAVSFMRSLPGRMRSAVGSLGSLLLNSGRSIIDGLRNGINSGIDSVLGMLRDLGRRAKQAFNDALSIFSPSRVFFQSGVFINEGLIQGIESGMGAVARTAETLANTVITPTLQLPRTATLAVNSIPSLPSARATATVDAARRDFGPYELKVDQGTLAKFTIDAVTGSPKEVADAANEGNRKIQFAGSGRRSG